MGDMSVNAVNRNLSGLMRRAARFRMVASTLAVVPGGADRDQYSPNFGSSTGICQLVQDEL
jgi:hypothetical protein